MIDEKKIIETIEKIRAINPEIIVRMIDDKPYYSIRYFNLDDCRFHVGYGSYKLEFVVEWLRTCFDVVDTKSGWIPVSERLPESEGVYLVTTKIINKKEVVYAFYSQYLRGFVCNGNAIAWQPLPEPYQEEL